MTDIISKEKRSWLMSRIRSKNTKPEKLFLKSLSKYFYPLGLRYRKYYKKLPGKPDVVFVKHKIAIFIDGDFWHGREFGALKKRPISNYWLIKIRNNMDRDKRNSKDIRKLGWCVLRFWEREIEKDMRGVLVKIRKALKR